MKKAESMLDAEISESMIRAKETKTIDVAFVVDSTTSMRGRIEGAKEKITEIQRRICKTVGVGATVRMAVVAYRDYKSSHPLEVQEFTEDVEKVLRFLQTLRVEFGHDSCEDVIGGLQRAVQLQWEAKTRIMYLMSDSPPHGRRFYDAATQPFVSKRFSKRNLDDHPDDPKQWEPTDNVMSHTVQLRIHFVGLQYRGTCKKMFETFSNLRTSQKGLQEDGLQTLVLGPSNDTDDFVKCVLKSTSASLKSSLTHGATAMKQHLSSDDTLNLDETVEIHWKMCQEWPLVQVLATSVDVQWGSKTKTNTTVHRFHIREKPFASGRMRYAFPAVSEDGQRFVIKVHKSKQNQTADAALADAETQAFARQFAVAFSRQVPEYSIQFLEVWKLSFQRWPVARYATLEQFVPGRYEKYTSNAGYKSDSQGSVLAEAFSHFTWQYSGGRVMVTDLQGFCQSILTDPQIHCKKKGSFSRGNLGIDGMDQFFHSHQCNALCRLV